MQSRKHYSTIQKMKTAVLVSDNHGLEVPLDFLREKYSDAEIFLHCGDSELPKRMLSGFTAVAGNNDDYGEYPEYLVLEAEGHRIYLTHGHRDMFLNQLHMLVKKANMLGCDTVCFGHTHVPCDAYVDGVHLLNPGSVWHNRDGSAPSYMILQIDKAGVRASIERL